MVYATTDAPSIDQTAIRIVVSEQQCTEPGPGAFGIGPANNDKLLAVQAFDFEPQTAIAGRIGRISPLRDDPL